MPFIQFQLRRGTAALWTSNNPVLAQGEFGYETDSGLMKLGTGLTGWRGLPYYYGPTGQTGATGVTGYTGYTG
jgi:hypothetical protein